MTGPWLPTASPAPAGIVARRRRRRSQPPAARSGGTRQPVLTVQTTARLTGLDVARILAACATAGYQVHVGDHPTRRDAEHLLRTVIAGYGRHAGTGWDTGLTHDQAGVVLRWAADQTRRLWPHLSHAALADHVARYAPPLIRLDLDPDGPP